MKSLQLMLIRRQLQGKEHEGLTTLPGTARRSTIRQGPRPF